MIRTATLAATVACLIVLPRDAAAQFRGPRGGNSGDDNNSEDSGRGRFRGFGRGGENSGGEDRGEGRPRWGGWNRSGGGDGEGGDDRPRWGGGGRSEGGEGRGGFGGGGFGGGGFGGPGGGFGGGFGPPGGFGGGGGFGPPGGFGGGFGGQGGPGGPGGGFRPSPDFLFDRLDRNQDGMLDGDELKNTWGPMQGMLERAGIQEGATKEDFVQSYEKIQEEFQGGRDRNGDGQNRNGKDGQNGKAYYKPAKKERVTLDLPDGYKNRDEDGDGQIGLYEWRAYRGDIEEFFSYDRNGDGFLTPREIAAGPMEQLAAGYGEAAEVASGDSPDPSSDPEFEKGVKYFGMLDTDHDGRATPEELGKLKKLRPAFEKAGISLDQEMNQDQFVSNYLKAVRQ